MFTIPKSDIRDRLVSPTPAWISLVLAILLVAAGGAGAFMFQKVERLENRLSIQTKTLDGIEIDVRAVSSTVNDVEYRVRIMKSDLSDIETSLESLEDSVLNLCLWVAVSRGRYVC